MTGRLDPPHERVTLTVDELRTLARLERAFALEAAPDRGSLPAGQAEPAPRDNPPRRTGRWRRLRRRD